MHPAFIPTALSLVVVFFVVVAVSFTRFLRRLSLIDGPLIRTNVSWSALMPFAADREPPTGVPERLLQLTSPAVLQPAATGEPGRVIWPQSFGRPCHYSLTLRDDVWARLHASGARVGRLELLGPDSLALDAYGRVPETLVPV